MVNCPTKFVDSGNGTESHRMYVRWIYCTQYMCICLFIHVLEACVLGDLLLTHFHKDSWPAGSVAQTADENIRGAEPPYRSNHLVGLSFQWNFFSKIGPFMRWCEEILCSLTESMTIWDMRIAWWIPKVTNTQSLYVKHFLSTAALDTRKRLSVTSQVHRLSVSLTCKPRRFTSEVDSFPIKPYEFLALLLVKILFRCLLYNTLSLSTDVIHLARVSLNMWSKDDLQFGHLIREFVVHVTWVLTAAHCFPGR